MIKYPMWMSATSTKTWKMALTAKVFVSSFAYKHFLNFYLRSLQAPEKRFLHLFLLIETN